MRTEKNNWRNQDVVVVHDVLESIREAIANREYASDDPNEVRMENGLSFHPCLLES